MIKSLVALAMIFVFMGFAIRSHLSAALLYWWFGIFKPQDWMWWDLSALRLPLIAAMLFIGQSIIKRCTPRVVHPISIAMVSLLALALFAEIVAGCANRLANLSPGYLATLVLVALLTERALRNRQAIFYLMLTVTLSFGFYTAKAGVSALLNGRSYYNVRVEGGAYGDSNAMALSAVMMMCFAIFTLQCVRNASANQQHSVPHWVTQPLVRLSLTALLTLVIGASIYFVIATESRGSALSLGIAITLWLLLRPKPFRWLLLGLTLSALTITVVPLPDEYRDRIASAFVEKEDLDGSAASRHHFWDVAKSMVRTHPFGVGVGCYAAHYSTFDTTNGLYGNFRSVHSSHYSILAEIGYAGILTWGVLFLITIGTLWRTRQRCKALADRDSAARFGLNLCNAMLAMNITFLFGGSFYELAYNDFTWLGFILAIASTRVLHKPGNHQPKAVSGHSLATPASSPTG